MYRFRVKGRPIRHIFHGFQSAPVSCERSLTCTQVNKAPFTLIRFHLDLLLLVKTAIFPPRSHYSADIKTDIFQQVFTLVLKMRLVVSFDKKDWQGLLLLAYSSFSVFGVQITDSYVLLFGSVFIQLRVCQQSAYSISSVFGMD